jgi:hypothetical protein
VVPINDITVSAGTHQLRATDSAGRQTVTERPGDPSEEPSVGPQ